MVIISISSKVISAEMFTIFEEGLIIRRVSQFLTGTSQPGMIPIPVFACKKCKKVFRKHIEEYEEADEFYSGFDKHYVIEAKTIENILVLFEHHLNQEYQRLLHWYFVVTL